MLNIFSVGSPFVVFWEIFKILFFTSFFWLPILLIFILFTTWMTYIRARYIYREGSTLLEIKLPKEILKSPAAMEVFLLQLFQPSTGNYVDVYLKGKVRPWFSLELVSIDGNVHFFIWTHKKFRNGLESQIYAQYPNVEIYEVDDYTKDVTVGSYEIWSAYLEQTQSDAYPIKTYKEYNLADILDEEQKIDPITPVIEYLGSLSKGEQTWIQILVQANKKEWVKEGRLFKKEAWKKRAEQEITKLKQSLFIKGEPGAPAVFNADIGVASEQIKAIQKSLPQPAFDVVIRAVYAATKEANDPGSIGGFKGSFAQYNSNILNGFKSGFDTTTDYLWEDFKGMRMNSLRRRMLDAYKLRSFFHAPYKNFKQHAYVLTLDQLATIFHFPGSVSSTPTFNRLQSKKSQPPGNLPL